MSIPTIQCSPDRAGAIRLLQASELPTSGLTDAHMGDFFYAGDSSAPVGIVGLEFYEGNALLRSLAVAAERRSSGLGSALVERAESHARARGARSIFLLTTTAERFFKSRGYVPADRAAAPEAIRSSREFAELCPASSAFLVKQLY